MERVSDKANKEETKCDGVGVERGKEIVRKSERKLGLRMLLNVLTTEDCVCKNAVLWLICGPDMAA